MDDGAGQRSARWDGPGRGAWAAAAAWGVVACLLALVGCAAEPCVDADGDGHGEGCEDGADCDDTDPQRFAGCDSPGDEPDCSADPNAPGCPCLRGASLACYAAAASTEGVAECRAGRQSCQAGRWTDCEGAVLPALELCNGLDDDCDGSVDEAAQSPCGGCDAECTGGVWGPPTEPFQLDEGLDVTERGELTLSREAAENVTVWVPNTGEGTVSKLDAASATELARYAIGGPAPERVAVDYNGDVWVLDRVVDGQSALVKIAGDASRCLDANGDGLHTSGGPADVLGFGEDECVLLRVPAGAPGELASSLAVDGTRSPDGFLGGNVWVGVGLELAGRMLEFDGVTGAPLRSVEVPGFAPHAAAFDPWGTQWVIDRQGKLLRMQVGPTEPVWEILDVPLPCFELEALAVAEFGRLTFSGFSCENVISYDPVDARWQQVRTQALRTTRGVAVLGAQSWVAHTSGELSRVGHAPLRIEETLPLASDGFEPLESIAVSADSLQQLWVVSTRGAPDGVHGVATRLESSSGAVTAQVAVGLGPRGQGDLTGNQLLGRFTPSAETRRVFDGCGFESLDPDAERIGRPTEWRAVHVAWVGEDASTVRVEARHAEARAGLAAAAFQALGTLPQDAAPFALDFPSGGVVELRLTLATAGWLGAPRIARVGIEWRCPGPD